MLKTSEKALRNLRHTEWVWVWALAVGTCDSNNNNVQRGLEGGFCFYLFIIIAKEY